MQHLREFLDDGVAYVGAGVIEHELVASGRARPIRHMDDPIWVIAVKLAVFINHLGLEPKAELHAETCDPIPKLPEAAGQLLPIDVPIAQRRRVIVTFAEPPVIQNK
ncbi:hypothetical protein D3C77_449060 [compost metagenome]